MRTLDEIVEYYRSTQAADWLGFTAEVLLDYLPFDKAQEFLKSTAVAENWSEPRELSEDCILAEMDDYMEFAWGKVESHRGISASRSVEKMTAWLWLLGDDDMVEFAKSDDNYAQYGAPVLRAVCEKYSIAMPSEDWWFENMTTGLPCMSGCDSGCGR